MNCCKINKNIKWIWLKTNDWNIKPCFAFLVRRINWFIQKPLCSSFLLFHPQNTIPFLSLTFLRSKKERFLESTEIFVVQSTTEISACLCFRSLNRSAKSKKTPKSKLQSFSKKVVKHRFDDDRTISILKIAWIKSQTQRKLSIRQI